MKAIKISADNKISVVDVRDLKDIQKEVDGYIEPVRPYGLYGLNVPNSESLIIICNEEGFWMSLDENRVATILYDPVNGCEIVGDILIMAEGFVNGEPDIVGLEDDQVEALLIALKNKFEFLEEE